MLSCLRRYSDQTRREVSSTNNIGAFHFPFFNFHLPFSAYEVQERLANFDSNFKNEYRLLLAYVRSVRMVFLAIDLGFNIPLLQSQFPGSSPTSFQLSHDERSMQTRPTSHQSRLYDIVFSTSGQDQKRPEEGQEPACYSSSDDPFVARTSAGCRIATRSLRCNTRRRPPSYAVREPVEERGLSRV